MFTPELVGDSSQLAFLYQMGDDGTITYSVDSALPMKRFINHTMKVVDASLDNINFQKVRGEAEIEYISVDEMPDGYEDAIGLADYNYNNNNEAGVDLLFDVDTIKGIFNRNRDKKDALRYVYLHELGHSLGLEHPFDDSDGDVLNDTTGDFTRMSYDFMDTILNGKVNAFTEG